MKLKMKNVSLLIILMNTLLYSQYPEAPEKWSTPVKLVEICSIRVASTPSISSDGNKLFMSGISYSNKTDSGWSAPILLNSNVNQNIARYPTISPDGKKLYFTKYLGGWNLFYSEWDTITNDWGVAKNCGPGVNGFEYGATYSAHPNDTTLIFDVSSQAYISYWNSSENKWGNGMRFPRDWAQFITDGGFWASSDLSKIYYVLRINGNYDIYVSYKDSSYDLGYTPFPKRLNIGLITDSLYNLGIYVGRNEVYPSLSPDGKTMFFAANYEGEGCIYVSRMLIDENGNPVSVQSENHEIPGKYELFNYPNPFNPSTTICYSLPQSDYITLKLFDILGKEVAILLNNEWKDAGFHNYQLIVDNYQLPSGIYIIFLEYKHGSIKNKTVLIK